MKFIFTPSSFPDYPKVFSLTSSISSQKHDHGTQISPSVEEWEAKRAVISRLYSSDGLTLKQVQAILENIHGFKAT